MPEAGFEPARALRPQHPECCASPNSATPACAIDSLSTDGSFVKRGFTLVEMAIILVIIGILLGMGAGLFGLLVKQVKRRQTQEVVDAAVQSIIGYAQTHKALPDSSRFSTVVRNPKDPYGKPLLYIYDPKLVSYCWTDNGTLRVRLCHGSNCTSYDEVSDVAFVVLSGGANYNIQTSNGTLVKVYDYGVVADDYPYDMSRPEPYDDVVKWVTIPELASKAGCSGLKITSPSILPGAKEGVRYTYQLLAEGGKPPYIWGLEDEFTGENDTIYDIGAGLHLNSLGYIYGTPEPLCEDSIVFSVKVMDSVNNTDKKDFSIPVVHRPVVIKPDVLPSGVEGQSYHVVLMAEGGKPPYNWNFSGDCPSGLSCSGNEIDGIPDNGTGGRSYNMTYTVSDSCNVTVTKKYVLVINKAYIGGPGGPGGVGSCLRYMVINKSGKNRYYSGLLGVSCIKWKENDGIILYPLSHVKVYKKRKKRKCLNEESSFSFYNVIGIDINGNCRVNYDKGRLYDDSP